MEYFLHLTLLGINTFMVKNYMCRQIGLALILLLSSFQLNAQSCQKTVYLTFDTGNMSVAQYVADTLKRHDVRATFFLANERTDRGDMALDDSWKGFWVSMVNQGHAFGSHTLHHAYFQKNGKDNTVILKPQFGPKAGKSYSADQLEVCHEIKQVDQRFHELTGKHISKIWRAPGGKTSPRLIEMGNACSYKHIAWSSSGFLGDELSSTQYPNDVLLKKALQEIKDGDITMAHLGIWSRKDPWAPGVLDQLIAGLKAKGFCFATIE
jgi:peptidoglycan/xylan/chitin deacetylase (PgdA/CDA1 family)